MSTAHDAEALADQLHSAAIHLLRQLRKEDDASGLSAPRLSALSVVVFGGPLTLGALARAEQIEALLQHLDQVLVRRDLGRHRLAVEGETNGAAQRYSSSGSLWAARSAR